jgi:DNA (cytosine-5)-methyltransferase 1
VSAYYNEWERYPAAWIRNLIAAGHVADGVVDERSIVELRATDLAATQCHFFAGIGGWSYALRLAGWPDDRPVWTASCPCQPFSTAGKGRGVDDERHLWPVLFELVRECRPAILFGEQVAGPAGRTWLDAVSADLESAGYAVGAANLCAAGVGAPHIRQRLYFVAVADADGQRLDGERLRVFGRGSLEAGAQAAGRGEAGERVADADGQRSIGRRRADQTEGVLAEPSHGGRDDVRLADNSSGGRREGRVSRDAAPERAGSSDDGRMGDADRDGTGRHARGRAGSEAQGDRAGRVDGYVGNDACASGPWSDAEWIPCTDGKSRPAQPGSFPLAYGVPDRVGKLRAYGNAIVAPLAAEFIGAVMDEIDARSAA